jgi:hypothetical protein
VGRYARRFPAAAEPEGAAARWSAICERAGAAGRAVAAEQAALAAASEGGRGWLPQANGYCRGADKRGETRRADAAACRDHCAPLGAACFQYARGSRTCRCAPRWSGVGASELGYVAWVLEGAKPLPAPAEGRRLLTAKGKRAKSLASSAASTRRRSGSAASRYLARARAVPLALHCVRSEPAAASVAERTRD